MGPLGVGDPLLHMKTQQEDATLNQKGDPYQTPNLLVP